MNRCPICGRQTCPGTCIPDYGAAMAGMRLVSHVIEQWCDHSLIEHETMGWTCSKRARAKGEPMAENKVSLMTLLQNIEARAIQADKTTNAILNALTQESYGTPDDEGKAATEAIVATAVRVSKRLDGLQLTLNRIETVLKYDDEARHMPEPPRPVEPEVSSRDAIGLKRWQRRSGN